MPELNRHGEHEATCLCCQYFSVSGYEAGSEYTPESGILVSCWKNKFKQADGDGARDIHAKMELAKDCDAFEGRK